jgi:CRP-like cAMP-binding protein
MHVRNFQADEVVFRQGDQGAGAILVLEGQVKVYANNTLLSDLDKGDFFGEITLAETDKRTADACCITKSRLVYFLKQDLEEWIEIEPRLGTIFLMNLASILAQRLHMANQLLSEKE